MTSRLITVPVHGIVVAAWSSLANGAEGGAAGGGPLASPLPQVQIIGSVLEFSFERPPSLLFRVPGESSPKLYSG